MFLLYLYDKAANLKKCGQMPKILIVHHSVLINHAHGLSVYY